MYLYTSYSIVIMTQNCCEQIISGHNNFVSYHGHHIDIILKYALIIHGILSCLVSERDAFDGINGQLFNYLVMEKWKKKKNFEEKWVHPDAQRADEEKLEQVPELNSESITIK